MIIHILALENDLFFAVRMRDTLHHHEMEVKTARNLALFDQGLHANTEEKPQLVIVHIAMKGVDWEEAIRRARASGYSVLAFGSHMDLEARAKALAAGALRVVANSKFSASMPELVKQMLNDPPKTPVDDGED